MAYYQNLTLSYLDFTSEASSANFRGIPLTAANFDAQVGFAEALATAIGGITLGNQTRINISHREDSGLLAPADPDAQREAKWLVKYHAPTTGNQYRLELPCFDSAALDANARHQAEIGDADVVDAFVSAFEDYVRAPDDGAAVVVDQILHVGRNT